MPKILLLSNGVWMANIATVACHLGSIQSAKDTLLVCKFFAFLLRSCAFHVGVVCDIAARVLAHLRVPTVCMVRAHQVAI